jgi:DNA-binding transcriptional regulator YhcF (GntR family)
MSWDKSIRSCKCPCGEGTIEQEIRDDDWGRSESGFPYIVCPKCKAKYKIVSITSRSYKPMRGDSVSYYCVPLDFGNDIAYCHDYKEPNAYEAGRNDFADYLVISYRLDTLKETLSDLESETNVSKLFGSAKSIAKDLKQITGTAKIKNLRTYIESAIERYRDAGVTCEMLDKQDAINNEIERKYEERIMKEGILIEL